MCGSMGIYFCAPGKVPPHPKGTGLARASPLSKCSCRVARPGALCAGGLLGACGPLLVVALNLGQRNCLEGDALGRMLQNGKEETGVLVAAGFHLPSALCVPAVGRSGGPVAESAPVLVPKALSSPKGKACCSRGALTGPRGPGPGTDFRLRLPQLVTGCIPRAQPWEVSGGDGGRPGRGARPTRRCEVAAGAAGAGDSHPWGEGAELGGQREGRAVWPCREPGTGALGGRTTLVHPPCPRLDSWPWQPRLHAPAPSPWWGAGRERTLPAKAGTRLRSPLPAQACSHCLQ